MQPHKDQHINKPNIFLSKWGHSWSKSLVEVH